MGLIDCRTPSAVSTCEGCRNWSGAVELGRLRVFNFQELVRATNNFSQKRILGKGSHSIVYKAVLNDGEVVAVKRPTLGRRTLQDAISFDNELDILSKVRHRHLVNLIGFCNEAREKLLVVEFMQNGTLFDNLHSGTAPLSWSARMDMALQAAKAIEALHCASPPIIHRDVKSSNILVDRNWDAKLSDLGLAVRGKLEDITMQGNPPAGTMGYIDPEYQTPSQLSSKSDVFSFGILLLEIMSGRKAIDVRFNPSSLIDWAVPLIKQGNALAVCDISLKPPQNVEVVQQLGAIAYRAVRQSKDRRPTMAEVVEGLRRIKKKLPSPLFGGNPPRVRRIALPKDEIRKNGQLMVKSSPAAVPKDELCEDTNEWVSFSKSEDASGERTSSASDSEPSSNSFVLPRRGWSHGDGDSEDQEPVKFAKACQGTRLATSTPESPIFEPNLAFTMIGSPMSAELIRSLARSPDPNLALTMGGSSARIDLIRNIARSPNSPLSRCPRQPGDRISSRKTSESPTFGSLISLRTVDARSTVTAPRIFTQGASGPSLRTATQGANSRFKRDENSDRGSHLSRGGETSNDSNSHVSLASQSSLPQGSSRQVLPNRNWATGGMQFYSKPPQEHGVRAGFSILGGSANRDSKVDSVGGPIFQPKVSFRMQTVPLWGVPTNPVNFYSNAESRFKKVDLPIVV